MAEIVFKEESYRVMGACFEVYKELGCGFLESVYQESLELELAIQEVPYQAQRRLALSYKGHALSQLFVPDLICFEKIIIELKAVKSIDDIHRAQVHNYLRATGYKLGILVNFGYFPKLEYERIVV